MCLKWNEKQQLNQIKFSQACLNTNKWRKNNPRINAEIKAYKAVVLYSLLYVIEYWIIYWRRHLPPLRMHPPVLPPRHSQLALEWLHHKRIGSQECLSMKTSLERANTELGWSHFLNGRSSTSMTVLFDEMVFSQHKREEPLKRFSKKNLHLLQYRTQPQMITACCWHQMIFEKLL